MSNCECETPSVEVPVLGIKLNLPESIINGGGGGGLRTWESDWFDIAASGVYTFTHNLGLTDAWKCRPTIVGQVTTAENGWDAGDIIFADGSNYTGATATNEVGWAICISENDAHVTFGNSTAFIQNKKTGGYGPLYKNKVRCKLLIDY